MAHQQLSDPTRDESSSITSSIHKDAASAACARLQRVYEAVRQVTECSANADPDQIAEVIAQNLRTALACDATSCFVYDDENDEIRFPPKLVGLYHPDLAYARGRPGRNSVVYHLIKDAATTQYITQDAQNDALLGSDFVRREGFVTTACFRLWSRTRVVGAFFVNYRQRHVITAEEESDLQFFAELAAITIANALHHERQANNEAQLLARVTQRWLSLVSSSWGHETSKRAITITYEVTALRRLLTQLPSGESLTAKLAKIERLAREIVDEPLTLPLSYEEGVESILLNDLLTERLRQLWSRDNAMTTRLQTDFQLAANATVRINPDWIKIVIDILVENALRAMQESTHSRLLVSTSQVGGWVKVTFADTGRGIPDPVRNRLLREPIPKNRGEAGNGIGLLLAQVIAHTYAGKIALEETSAEGTKIALFLPLEPLPLAIW